MTSQYCHDPTCHAQRWTIPYRNISYMCHMTTPTSIYFVRHFVRPGQDICIFQICHCSKRTCRICSILADLPTSEMSVYLGAPCVHLYISLVIQSDMLPLCHPCRGGTETSLVHPGCGELYPYTLISGTVYLPNIPCIRKCRILYIIFQPDVNLAIRGSYCSDDFRI